MSICQFGMESKLDSTMVNIFVPMQHYLVRLANAMPWLRLEDVVLPDLKMTAKGFWWVGRKLNLRIHLGAFILQARYRLTDRETEEQIKYNAAFQVFCGRDVVPDWHAPDHTSIARFRMRLRPETQRLIITPLIQTAEALGFSDPGWMDIDSTVQEANIAYPSDANLMLKLSKAAGKLCKWLAGHTRGIFPKGLALDVTRIASKAKSYFFLAKNTSLEKRREVFKELHAIVSREVLRVVRAVDRLPSHRIKRMPESIRRMIAVISSDAKGYLSDVAFFIRTKRIKAQKILSFHARDVACIVKGKLGKKCEFGRVFQLGRIGGNFLIPLSCSSVRMEDKHAVVPMILEHARIFGANRLKSLAADRGYYSQANCFSAARLGVTEIGLQCPGRVKATGNRDLDHARRLRDRRAGRKPLIGHAKSCGLRRSRMKSDPSTLASGYRSVLGFNLRQFERHQNGMMKKIAEKTVH